MSKSKTTVYQYGTTVRFESQFFDFDGTPIDPDTVQVKIYDEKYRLLETVPATPYTGETGKYFHDYVTPSKEQRLIYEWYALIDGKPSLKRDDFMTRFL